jgi:deoxyribodipyrimidine photo-lyase
MPASHSTGLVWLRRDLRAHDNAALAQALRACGRVHCAFVFDQPILEGLPRADRRVEFIRESLAELAPALRGSLIVRHGRAAEEIPRLARELGVGAVFANHDYEPEAIARDDAVRTALARERIEFHTFKDQVLFERRELLTGAGKPYTVFTPYRKAWLARLGERGIESHPVHLDALAPGAPGGAVPSLREIGFEPTNLRDLGIEPGGRGGARAFDAFLRRIDDYHVARDFPAQPGTSGLGIHLRFGTVSVRELAREAQRRADAGSEGAAAWLSELAWRDFFFQILANFPHVVNGAFRPEYDAIAWESGARGDELFAAWCEGRTGYPIVDAAMAQLAATGSMHNRLRMVAASFLVKDLGVDWRRGERWFALKLNDYDLAANNGNWQWAAGTGCDAQPWFRIFNPQAQERKFDADGEFVRRWLPYTLQPPPVVDHAQARERTLARYAKAVRR